MSAEQDPSAGQEPGQQRQRTVWIVAGPTASGKSHLALDLAVAHDGVVINADSMQVYREIPVLSAQPSPVDAALAPHMLYGFYPITKNFSSAQWAQLARDAIDKAFEQGKQPILVGGSGLYFKALIEGFAVMPPVPPFIRKNVSDLYDMLGAKGFHDALREIDPVAASRLHPTDRQRCIRAREVYEVSSQTLTEWQAQPKQNIAPNLNYRSVVLLPERAWLNARIDSRFVAMIESGGLEEARFVHALNPSHDLTGTHALGLQALRDHIDGRIILEEAVRRGQNQSRQFAKRQYTWFRNQALPHSLIIGNPDQARPEQDWLARTRKHLLNEGHVHHIAV